MSVGAAGGIKDRNYAIPARVVASDSIDAYNKAKTDKSCASFEKLAADKTFVLQDLAKLRAEQYCLKGPIDFNAYATWLRPAAIDAGLFSAEARNDTLERARLSIEKSKQNLTPEEKITLIEQAAEFAKAAKDEELTKASEERLLQISPCHNEAPMDKDYLSVADDCRYHRKFERAKSLYQKVIASKASAPAERISAYKGLRQTHKNNRDDEAYLASNLKLIRFLENTMKRKKNDKLILKQYLDAGILQARALWTRGKTNDGLKFLARIEKKLKNRWPLTEVYWVKARILEEKGEIEAANLLLDKALAQTKSDSETKDRILWTMAWNDRRAKNLPLATELLQRLVNETQNESTHHRAAFWLGKVQLEQKKEDDAKKTFEKLIEDDPLGYYGLLAYLELDRPIVPVKKTMKDTPSADSKELQSVLRPELAEALIQTQELDALQAYLEEIARVYKKSRGADDLIWVRLLRYYAHAGLYIRLYENLNQISVDQRNEILENHPELLFPRPFEAEVAQAAKATKVPAELIYSIMRQESAFNPKSRSIADAFGLMQVLPEIAQKFTKKYDLKVSRNEDLYDPAINVKLGAALLRAQLDRYHGQFILAVASYNANDRAIKNWMTNRFHGNALEFIEDIPYDETRGYVRLVMRNLVFYNLLGSKEASMPFPKQVLELSN
jgi:soluble lytic murein transglycosylase